MAEHAYTTPRRRRLRCTLPRTAAAALQGLAGAAVLCIAIAALLPPASTHATTQLAGRPHPAPDATQTLPT